MIDGIKLEGELKRLGMSKMDLARALGWTGAPTYLYNLINGKHEATFDFTIRVAEAMGVHPSAIAKDEVIESFRLPSSSLRLAEDDGEYVFTHKWTVPIVGYVSAGESDCLAYTDGDVPAGHGLLGEVDWEELADCRAYAVQIRGDSMLPYLREGDIAIVSPDQSYNSGERCLVRAKDGRVWLKRVRKRDQVVFLESDNPMYETIDIKLSEIDYIHKVIIIVSR